MNSKNFLFAAVFVVLSFFAICFVWEARSALRESEVNDVSVGACVTGSISVSVPNVCHETTEEICSYTITTDYVYTLYCGCTQLLSSYTDGCTSAFEKTKCFSSAGNGLFPDSEGDAVSLMVPYGCGLCSRYECHNIAFPSIPVDHHCPKDQNDYHYLIQQKGCERDSKLYDMPSCGDRQSTTSC